MGKVVQDECLGHCGKNQRDSYYRIIESLRLRGRKNFQKGLKGNSDAKGKCSGQGRAWAPAQDHPNSAGFGEAASVISCSSSPWASPAVQSEQPRPVPSPCPGQEPSLPPRADPHPPTPPLPTALSLLARLPSPRLPLPKYLAPRKISVFTTERAA